jgi:N-acetylglucosaminyldiphosphoundecaprenol N-acetyl-beta-D-mannosaminyltransferase
LHHGFINRNPSLNQAVIDDINSLNPDIVLVGFGTPLQEYWIDTHKSQLKAGVLYAVGAVFDYHTGRLPRCPAWMGNLGLEWLFRFCVEPKRLFARYIIGNPWFMARLFWTKHKANKA